MKYLYVAFLIFLFGCTSQQTNYTPITENASNLANITNVTLAETPQNKTYDLYIYYFYRYNCQYSKRANPVIDEMEIKYPNVKFYRFETGKNQTNLAFFHKFAGAYNITAENRGVPVVYIDSEYLQGDSRIIEYLEREINACLKYPCAKNPIDVVNNASG